MLTINHQINKALGRVLTLPEVSSISPSIWLPRKEIELELQGIPTVKDHATSIADIILRSRKPILVEELLKEMNADHEQELALLRDNIAGVLNIVYSGDRILGFGTLINHCKQLQSLACRILPSFEQRSGVTQDSIFPMDRMMVGGAFNAQGIGDFCTAVNCLILLPNGLSADKYNENGIVDFWEKETYMEEEIAIANIDIPDTSPKLSMCFGFNVGDFPNFVCVYPRYIEAVHELEYKLHESKRYSNEDLFLYSIQELIEKKKVTKNDFIQTSKSFIYGEEIAHAQDGIFIKKTTDKRLPIHKRLLKENQRLETIFFRDSKVQGFIQKHNLDDIDIDSCINELSAKTRNTIRLMEGSLSANNNDKAMLYGLTLLNSIFHKFTPANSGYLTAADHLIAIGFTNLERPESYYARVKDFSPQKLLEELKAFQYDNFLTEDERFKLIC